MQNETKAKNKGFLIRGWESGGILMRLLGIPARLFCFLGQVSSLCGCAREPAREQALLEKMASRTGFNAQGYVVEQRKLGGIRFGAGTLEENGCGWAAAYNVSRILGGEKGAYASLEDMERGALQKAKCGVNPFYIARYFRQKGYAVRVCYTRKEADNALKNAAAGIFLYGWRAEKESEKGKWQVGAHFVALRPLANGQVHSYNGGTNGLLDAQASFSAHESETDVFRLLLCIGKRTQSPSG